MQLVFICYRIVSNKKIINNILVCAFIFLSFCATAQTIPNQVLPSPFFITTSLTNTNGNWVYFYPIIPNDIDQLETELFRFPKRGQGVMAVEIRLEGADGGTATFNDGSQSQFAEGGQGGIVQFKVSMQSLSQVLYSNPFYIAYGKQGQSKSGSSFVTGGGGGSTGMCLLSGTVDFTRMHRIYPSGLLIAGAGGGGGGWAAQNVTKHGKGAGTGGAQNPIFDVAPYELFNNGQLIVGTYSGGASWDTAAVNLRGFESNPAAHNVFNFTTGPYGHISTLFCGQGGGQPTYYNAATGGTTTANFGQLLGGYSPSIAGYPTVVDFGGSGGSGFNGGGAGACPLTDYNTGNQYLGAGAGGGNRYKIPASIYQSAGLGGDNFCASNHSNIYDIFITPVNSTSTPQSGIFAYRTISDNIPPYALITTSGTLELPLRHNGMSRNSANQVTLPFSTIYCSASDNDSVQSAYFTKNVFTCADTGYHQVRLIAVDFAGNRDTSDNYLTVHVTDAAPPHLSTYPLEGQVRWVNISSGPRAVIQSDFPTATDNCSPIVTYSWTPHTFDCADLAGPVNISYVVTDGNGNSDTLNQQFIVISGGTTQNVYVDASATGANNGSSWSDAFTNLQDAFNFYCSHHRNIYIAEGTYYPDRGTNQTLNDRTASFSLKDGDKLYGGFPSGGSVFSQRDPAAYQVVLSGNINNALSNTDNSYHVVTIPAGISNTLLDGITIADGRADENVNSFGGGIRLLSALADSITKLTLQRCVLSNNYATGHGAAVGFPNVAIYGKVVAINSIFADNAAGGNGGAFYSSNASSAIYITAEFSNCVFTRNTATNGGALYFQNTTAQVINCSSGYNKATISGGAISSVSSTINVRNTILWSDTASNVQNEIGNPGQCNFAYSNVQGSGGSGSWNNAIGTNNGFNIDINPQYNSANDFESPPSSPSRNSGLKLYNTTSLDIRGVPRIVQDTIDMGAYEINPIVYVAADAAAGGDGNTWATAFNKLSDGLNSAFFGYYVKDVWIKTGTYRPESDGNGVNQGRFNTFQVPGSEKIYGGFAGNESSLSQRNIPANPTILDGDIGSQNDSSDNAYHVITITGTFPSFDGLIIQNGNANHPTLAAYQTGGGIYHTGIGATPTPSAINCVFRNNAAYSGGAVAVSSGNNDYTFNASQCLFYNNYAKFYGGAIYVQNGSSSNTNVTCNLYNCTAANNIANGFGGGFVETININGSGTAVTNIYNSVLWGNFIYQNGGGTLAQDYHNTNSNATTNIYNTHTGASNPDFVNPANPVGTDSLIMTDDDGYALQTSSIAINSGNNAYIPADITSDITGKVRIGQGQVDAGAYENWGCLGLTTLYVDSNIAESGTGANWSSAYRYLSDALQTAKVCPLVETIHIAKGTYYPSGTNNYWASRDTAFYINRPLKIYGGYPSGGGIQNSAVNATVLTGNINSTNDDDNTYHILIINSGVTDTTLLDGLTFEKGNASQNGNYTFDGVTYSRSSGGAIVSNNSHLLVNDCVFKSNYAFQGGASVYCKNGSVTSTANVFENNTARYGGAIRVEGTGTIPVASINSNVFYKNISFSGGGGALSLFNGGFTVSNNLFAYDSCLLNQSGGAINISGGKSIITGNTFYKNFSAAAGGAISLNTTVDTQLIANNVIYFNTDNAGNVQVQSGSGVITDFTANAVNNNPPFSDTINLQGADGIWATSDDGLIMVNTSPFINTGNSSFATGNTDITGAPRIQFGSTDPGAYENSNAITRWYVSSFQDSAAQDGTSWATAFQKFEDGINAAKPGDSVWVAQGIYTPTSGASFSMKNKVKIFGGFAANETTLAQRNLSYGHNAVLNGNGAGVLNNVNIDSTSVLDGFIIQNGNTTQGGGILNTNSSPLLANLVFTENSATLNGGAMANINSSPKLQNAIFYNNTSTGSGGGIYNSGSNAIILHTTFYNNNASSGGAVYNNFSSSPAIGNCIFNGNTAVTGADIYTSANASVNHSMLQSGISTNGNVISNNPFFSFTASPQGQDGLWFTADDGLQVGYLSSALNSGDNALALAIATDISGFSRLQNNVVDMGAYESALLGFCDSAALNNQNAVYVDGNIAASGDGSSWEEAYRSLKEALTAANYCPNIDTVFVARGTYYPTGNQNDDNRSESFSILRSGLYIMGGYPNGGGNRNPTANNTFLSGDIGIRGNTTDNSYHVVTFENIGISGMDGFIITNGNADSIIEPFNSGGGVYVKGNGLTGNMPQISNCVFTGNQAAFGAAVFNNGFGIGNNASPIFTNCVFADNTASTDGGAIYNDARAGGMSSPRIINCTFSRNNAAGKGGGIYDAGNGGSCGTNIINSVLWGNTSAIGTASQQQVYNDAATDTASYSLFQSGVPLSVYNAGQNISSNPLFAVDTLPIGFVNQWMNKYNGLALKNNSPGLQAGNLTVSPLTDIAGILRQPLPDMGAYQNNSGGTGTITQNVSACDSLLSPSYRYMWYNSGNYTDTVSNVLGSDTFYLTNLTLYQSAFVSNTVSTCGSYQSPDGNYMWDSTGIYYDTLQTVNGCDSIIMIDLTITDINDSVSVDGAVCTSFQNGASYQWIDCNTNQPIIGAMSQTYTAIQNGSYACVITSNSCIDTTACVSVTILKTDATDKFDMQLYPNPNSGKFIIKHNHPEILTAYVVSMVGKTVEMISVTKNNQQLDISNLPGGIYLIFIKGNQKTLRIEKLVKH
jgi:predicted outer membrane repeat protein